jgi:LysM repeat protein
MRIITLTLFLVIAFFTNAFGQDLIVKGTAPNLYLVHKVVPKENWFSVGRLYNVNAKELAKYNAVAVEKGLAIDQMIKIPLTTTNLLSAKNTLAADESKVPFYHVVEKSEGLYRMSINMGTTMQDIRTNNNLTNDALSTGAKIIVGYLKVKTTESSLAGNAVIDMPPPNPPKEIPKEITPVIVEQPKKEIPQVEAPKKETPKAPAPIVSETPKLESNNVEGFFKAEFQKDNSYGKARNSVTGIAAAFKTMAGWADNKYYALMDGVQAGSIIQITNTKTGKTIYAKILGEMQEIKQNHGLKIRISNAAASALDAIEETFEVAVKY